MLGGQQGLQIYIASRIDNHKDAVSFKKYALKHCRIMVYLPSEYREVPPVDLLSWLFDNTGVDVEKDVRILSRTHNTICCILISTDPD